MNSHIIRGPWTQQPGPPRMSMSQFRSQVHHHLSNITVFENSLQDIASVLAHPHKQFPLSYSDYVAKTLDLLRGSLKEFCLFIEENGQLPLALTALSYGFLSPLLFLESQTRSLTTLVEDLCLASTLRPSDIMLLSQRAKWVSHTLAERVTQLPTTINALLDRASFHEAQLTAIVQGQSTPSWRL